MCFWGSFQLQNISSNSEMSFTNYSLSQVFLRIPDATSPKNINLLQFKWKWISEAVAQRCSVKKVLLEISQNLQENTCARVSFLIKLQAPFHRTHLGDCFLVFSSVSLSSQGKMFRLAYRSNILTFQIFFLECLPQFGKLDRSFNVFCK